MCRSLATATALALLTSLTLAQQDNAVVRKHWFVSGQVQGVSFRAFTYEAAHDLKLKGWVRNLTDGRVEIVADGAEKAVAQLLEKVKKGPPLARVTDVKDARTDPTEQLAPEFEIRDSARPPKEAP